MSLLEHDHLHSETTSLLVMERSLMSSTSKHVCMSFPCRTYPSLIDGLKRLDMSSKLYNPNMSLDASRASELSAFSGLNWSGMSNIEGLVIHLVEPEVRRQFEYPDSIDDEGSSGKTPNLASDLISRVGTRDAHAKGERCCSAQRFPGPRLCCQNATSLSCSVCVANS